MEIEWPSLLLIFGLLFSRTTSTLEIRREHQTEAVVALIRRQLPRELADHFRVKVVHDHDEDDVADFVRVFTTFSSMSNSTTSNTTVWIRASSGVAAARGFHHYLKYYCKAHVAWETRHLELPEVLPEAKFRLRSHHSVRYFGNACLFGYTLTYFDFSEWSRLIDWLAMMGVNSPLASGGQEVIWRRVYTQLGLNESQLSTFFTDPSFLPWNRMGNLVSLNGPLSDRYVQLQVKLQHRILKRMRSLGMKPILPAFAGLVPHAMATLFPETNFYSLASWNGFESALLMDPRSPLFKHVGGLFIKMYRDEFGVDHMYNSDPLNENYVGHLDLEALAKAIYSAMEQVDEKAVWVLQGWMFRDSSFWTTDRVKRFLQAVPKSRLLILDLESTHLEQYTRTNFYFGHDFVFNDLNNFGGATGLFGRLNVINERMFDASNMAKANNASMVGIGIAPEGLSDAYLPAEFVLELAWRQKRIPNINRWIDWFVAARYGWSSPSLRLAWRLMAQSVFNADWDTEFIHRRKIITHIPGLPLQDDIWYDVRDVHQATLLLISNSDTLRHDHTFHFDVVDWTRQILVDLFPTIYKMAIDDFDNLDNTRLQLHGQLCVQLLRDLDHLLATDQRFMLGPKLSKLSAFASTAAENDQLAWGFLNQLSLWGPNGEILDYATKQWSGLIDVYHTARYELFFDILKGLLDKGSKAFDFDHFRKTFVETIAEPLCNNKYSFPTKPKGDAVEVAEKLLHKWTNITNLLTLDNHFTKKGTYNNNGISKN